MPKIPLMMKKINNSNKKNSLHKILGGFCGLFEEIGVMISFLNCEYGKLNSCL
jgi:hypothetical protein